MRKRKVLSYKEIELALISKITTQRCNVKTYTFQSNIYNTAKKIPWNCTAILQLLSSDALPPSPSLFVTFPSESPLLLSSSSSLSLFPPATHASYSCYQVLTNQKHNSLIESIMHGIHIKAFPGSVSSSIKGSTLRHYLKKIKTCKAS